MLALSDTRQHNNRQPANTQPCIPNLQVFRFLTPPPTPLVTLPRHCRSVIACIAVQPLLRHELVAVHDAGSRISTEERARTPTQRRRIRVRGVVTHARRERPHGIPRRRRVLGRRDGHAVDEVVCRQTRDRQQSAATVPTPSTTTTRATTTTASTSLAAAMSPSGRTVQ